MSLPTNGWKNKNGTSERTCKCGSWKEHWVRNSQPQWPLRCSVSNCINHAEVGAHVINSDVNGEWIVPLCIACNNRTGEFSLKDGVTLVPANKAITNC